MDASSSTEHRGTIACCAALGPLLLAFGCGGVAVVEEGEGGASSSSSNTASGSVTSGSTSGGGAEECVACAGMFAWSDFQGTQVCAGPHREAFEALWACACQPTTCDGPKLCQTPVPAKPAFCDEPSGWVDGNCSTCMEQHCFDEAETCRNLPFNED